LCYYLEYFYKLMRNDSKLKIKMSPRQVFVKDVENLLRAFNFVKSLHIELMPSAAQIAGRVLGESETLLQSLSSKFKSKSLLLRWKSSPGGKLEITIDELLDIFHQLEEGVISFKVQVKKELWGQSVEIDLMKSALIFKKPIRLAKDAQGNLLRSTDTDDAVNVLYQTIDEVLPHL